ncbi:hypothetical protein CR194_05445 [Salipaludibacillus keqinensis]|uniref:Uncharacterized protein n=1 Tax=Salipaludibacillus keqinensis TaxID=2045207 RepID=A0A323TJ57_9BACI|nr:hypothetical protein [Salipaludibacillus keqinensis]PYZ94961.1 hypothetical protein CR194_05445 [Salipaludibacillus keqinensis]
MGLDMYLVSLPKIEGMDYYEVHSASADLGELEEEQNEIYRKIKPHIKHFEEFGMSWKSLREEVAYWRKANQIHHWFVENLHNGNDEPLFTELVTKQNLEDLYNLCVKVLENRKNPQDSLPSMPGPFFGYYSYDDFYYYQIEETKSILEDLLNHFDFDSHYLMYQCSW